MKLFVLAFLVGVCGVWFVPWVLACAYLLLLLGIAAIFYVYFRNKFSLLVLALFCGFCWVMWFAHLQLARRLPKSMEGVPVVVTGEVVSLPQQKPYATEFLFKTKHRLLRLNWYDLKAALHPGDIWNLKVKLIRPHSFMNPGGFDYEAYLFANGINATGYVVNNYNNSLIAQATYSQIFNRVREFLSFRIKKLFLQQPFMSFILALVVGDRSEVSASQWEVLRHTGTNHLIAIAGLHIGLVTAFVFFLVEFLWRRSVWLTSRIASQQAAAIVSLLSALFYSLLAGFLLQTERAFIMLLFFFGAFILRRRITSWQAYFLALFAVLIFNPLSVIGLNFWMSFIAVGAIIYSTFGRIGGNKIWRKYGKIQLVIMLAVIPLSLMVFHETSLVCLIANMIAIPWFAVVIMPLCFVGTIFLCIHQHFGFIFLWLALKNLQILWVALRFLANLPHVVLHQAISNLWLFGFVFIAMILLLAPKKFPAKYLAIIFLLPLLTYKAPTPLIDQAWFTLFDVGQGLASIVRTKHHVLIFDTGPKFGADFDAASAVILPYLQFYDINKIDILMVSHGDNDHIGGSGSLLKNIKVNKILTSIPRKFSVHADHCYRGQKWRWDGVNFKVLSPLKRERYLGNNSSCVLRIDTKKQSILLTGDMQKPVEDRLICAHDNVAVKILVAPHHGSRTSSSVNFVKASHPKFVLYPVGYHNRFHFPSKLIEGRYQKIGAQAYNVAHTGAITFALNNHNLTSKFYRIVHHHLWND